MDPGAVGFGYKWYKSDTGDVVIRNTSNTGWILQGNANQVYLGQLNRAGGKMTGAILGRHEIAALAGGNFTYAPTILGATVAVVNYVDERDNYVLSQIEPLVAAGVASTPGVSVSNNLTTVIGGQSYAGTQVTITYTGACYADGTPIAVEDIQALTSTKSAAWIDNSGTPPMACILTRDPLDPTTWDTYSCQFTVFGNTVNQLVAEVNNIGFAIKPTA